LALSRTFIIIDDNFEQTIKRTTITTTSTTILSDFHVATKSKLGATSSATTYWGQMFSSG